MRTFLQAVFGVFAAALLSLNTQGQSCPGSPGCPAPSFDPPTAFTITGPWIESIDSADFNGDGNLDLALAGPSGTFVYFGNGLGSFGSPLMLGSSWARSLTVLDFNNDGNDDVADNLRVYLGNGEGGFTLGPVTGNSNVRYLTAADFNGDDNPDLIYIEPDRRSENFTIKFGDGNGGFSSTYQHYLLTDGGHVSDNVRTVWLSMVAADLDDDGDIDIAMPTMHWYSLSEVKVFLNNGSGSFSEPAYFPSPLGVVAGDFDRDNRMDLASPFGVVAFGNGLGSFDLRGVSNSDPIWDTLSTIQDLPAYPTSHLPRAYLPVAADMDYDGFLDLVTAGRHHDRLGPAILLNSGDGSGAFDETFSLDTGILSFDRNDAVAVHVADVNNDGKADIIAAFRDHNLFDSSILVFTNNALAPTESTTLGTDVTVQTIGAELTFDNVSSSGITTVQPIDPATVGDVPGGFAVADIAFEVSTTATFTGSVTTCFTVSSVNDESEFLSLRVLHKEGEQLVDRTSSHDFANRKICATTTSFSPFYLATVGKKVQALFDQSKAYKSGSTIPVKVRILDGADQNISAATLPLTVRGLRRIGSATAAIIDDAGNSNPDYLFRYDSGLSGYIYNLKTTGLSAGKYVLSFYAGSDRTFLYTVTFDVR